MLWVRRLIWLGVIVAGIGAFSAYKLFERTQRAEHATEGDFGRVPDFALRDQTGTTVTNRDYQGRVWIASFVFTRCRSVCPLLTAKFAAVQKKLANQPGLRFVSISVDPQYDTPEVLAAYAAKFGARPEHWRFLTGPLADIEKTVVKGFKIHIGEAKPDAVDPTLIEIMHGEHFVLVDRDGTIRGYFQSDEAGLAELEAAARKLSENVVVRL